jgi:hypothetical protein
MISELGSACRSRRDRYLPVAEGTPVDIPVRGSINDKEVYPWPGPVHIRCSLLAGLPLYTRFPYRPEHWLCGASEPIASA